MYAAGHPPLPAMEIATFAKNQPQHWRDAGDVPYFHNASAEMKRDYHLETIQFQRTRFALVGAIVALRETMQLIADRAATDPKEAAGRLWPELLLPVGGVAPAPPTPQAAHERWPELAMAHSECYGCHHERSKSWRQTRGYGYPPERKDARRRSRPAADQVVAHFHDRAGGIAGGPPSGITICRCTNARAGRAANQADSGGKNAQPFGDPARMRTAARSGRLVEQSDSGSTIAPYDSGFRRALLLTLADLKSLRFADYESARMRLDPARDLRRHAAAGRLCQR